MALPADEFIRRFLLHVLALLAQVLALLAHVLPIGFKKIRHFGLFSNGTRSTKLVQA